MLEELTDSLGDRAEEKGFGRRSYYYNYAIHAGKLVIDGAYSSEQEALRFGYKNIPCQFETFCSSSRDSARVTKEIKHRVWGQTGNIDNAINRASHKNPDSKGSLLDKKEGGLI